MAGFEVVRQTALSPTEAWRRLTDWERHGDLIPLTEVLLTGSIQAGVGATFVGRTALGPLRFDDPMEVTRWQPPAGDEPGVCHIVKHGKVITGWAELTVTPDGSGSVIHWHEVAGIGRTGRLLDLPNRVVGKRIFGRLVDGLLNNEP